MWSLLLFYRSNSQYAQVTEQTSLAQSSCPTQTVRRSSPAPETASSSTPTPRRVQSTTDSVSSPVITEQHMRYYRAEPFPRTHTWLLSSASHHFLFRFLRLWRYQMILTRSCPAGKMARCDGSTFVRRRAALKRTAKMYGDSCGVFSFIAVQTTLTLPVCCFWTGRFKSGFQHLSCLLFILGYLDKLSKSSHFDIYFAFGAVLPGCGLLR